MTVRATADRVTDRLEERLEPARERATERLGEAGERVRGAVASAPDTAERFADEVGDRSRETADRLERYLEDHLDEEALQVWGPRVAFAAGGLIVGLLLGWLLSRRRDRADEDEGFAQAPRAPREAEERPFKAVRNN